VCTACTHVCTACKERIHLAPPNRKYTSCYTLLYNPKATHSAPISPPASSLLYSSSCLDIMLHDTCYMTPYSLIATAQKTAPKAVLAHPSGTKSGTKSGTRSSQQHQKRYPQYIKQPLFLPVIHGVTFPHTDYLASDNGSSIVVNSTEHMV
jgi:hypothetical protein